MDQTRATTDGDGLAKHDRKHSLDSTEHENDHTEKEQDGGDPWAKVSAYSCTAGSTSSNDSSCSPTKLPHVELITHDPSAQVLSTNDAARQLSNDANAARNGESVLKRLAAAASPSGALDAAPLNSGFQSVAQVSLRPEASANKSASGFEAVPQTSTRTEVAQTNTAQTVDKSGVPVIRASDLVVKESTPGVKIEPTVLATNTTVARDLSSTTSGFQSVTQVALRTDGIVEKNGKVVSSEALVVTPIAPVTRAVYAPATNTAETTTPPISAPARVETTAAAPASTNKPASGLEAVAPTSANKPTSGFEAVPQNSTRTEVAQTNTTQTIDKSGVPVIRASDLVVKESTPGVKIEPTALATNTTVARDLSGPVAPAKDTIAVTSTLVAKDSNPATARVESAASTPPPNNKVEVASTSQVSGFQSVTQVALRTDGIVEKSGKVVSSEALVITPIAPVTRAVYAPTATTAETATSPISTPARVETTTVAPSSTNKPVSGFEAVPQTSTRTEVAQTNTAQTVDKSGVPVIRASDLVVKESTPGVKIEPTALATNTTLARDLSGPVAAVKDSTTTTTTLLAKDSNPATARVESATSTPPPNNKVEVASTSQVSGFQSVTQVALRTDGIVEKSGKVVSSEALVVTPIAPVTRAVYTPTATTAETATSPISTPARVETTAVAPASTNKPASGFEAVPQTSTRTEVAQTNTAQTVDKSGVPVIRASDLVVKESTPGVKIEPTALATNTTLSRDLSSPSSGFQSVTQVALRTDGIVEKSGKVVSSEALVVTPIAPVTRAVYAPAATTAETATSPISTPARVETTAVAPASTNKPASGFEAVAPTSANKPASGFEAVPQTSTRTEVAQTNTAQTVDKSGVPVIRASDLVVKESTPGVKIEPTVLATNTTVARDLSSTTSGFQSVTQVALRTDGIVEKSGKVVSSEALVVTPIAPVTRAVYVPAATTAETATSPISTPARVETTAVAPASTNKPASGFEAVPQTSTRTEVAQTNTAQTVDKSGVPVIRASDLVVKESTPGVKIEPTPLATNTTLARDLNNTIAPAKDTSNTAASSKTEVASSSPVSGFQSVASASLRPDAVVEKSGKIVSSEALVVTPIAPVTRAVYTPTAVTPEASVAATTSRAETTATAPAVDKSGVPVIRASDLVVKESTPGVKIEPTVLATNTTLARDLSSTTVQTKDTSSIPTSSKTEVPSSSPVSGFQSVASASLRPDGIVDKNGKTISAESFAVAPIVPVTKASASLTNSPASAAAAADTVSFTNQASGSKVVSSTDSNPQSTIRTDAAMAITTSAITSAVAKELTAKAEPTMRVLDNLQTAANSTAPKAIGTEHGQIGQIGQISQLNQLNQPTTALSAALAAAINGRMLGHQTETSKPFINGQGTAAMIDTSAVATTKGSIITVAANTKTEPGSGAGNRGEGVAPAKTDAVSVNAEIRFPLGTKVKKSETEEGDDDGKTTTATSAKVFGAGGNGGAGTNSGTGTGTGTTNTANGQVIDPSVAGMIGGTITPKPFDLPPLEITDKENENGRATKSNGSNNAANNSGNKVNGGPSQKEMSDALQALIEKRRKERTRKPVTSTGKKTPVYKPEKQRRCLVLKGDTLDSLAEQYLADSNLAELIYEINKGFWREKRRAGVVYLEFIPGSTIFLPTEEEIALFRRKKLEGGKPYLSFKCAPPKAVRSLRQSVKQNQQQQEATVELKLDPKLDLEPEQDTVVIAEAVPPTVFTANAPANSENSIEKALAVQLIAHLAQVSDTSRLLQPNQAKQVRELEETSRVTVVGEQSAVDATGYVARIEVLCENVWQPVMEYIIDGALGDATLKIYSLGGKVREIDLDLPLSIIREMAFNDLTANRLNYCKKYLLGRKIFC